MRPVGTCIVSGKLQDGCCISASIGSEAIDHIHLAAGAGHADGDEEISEAIAAQNVGRGLIGIG